MTNEERQTVIDALQLAWKTGESINTYDAGLLTRALAIMGREREQVQILESPIYGHD